MQIIARIKTPMALTIIIEELEFIVIFVLFDGLCCSTEAAIVALTIYKAATLVVHVLFGAFSCPAVKQQ